MDGFRLLAPSLDMTSLHEISPAKVAFFRRNGKDESGEILKVQVQGFRLTAPEATPRARRRLPRSKLRRLRFAFAHRLAIMRAMKTTAPLFALLCTLLLAAPALAVDEPPADSRTEQLDIREDAGRKETVLDLVFGTTPAPPTEHGTLIVDAFDDKNGDGKRDDNEPALQKEIVCTVDKIDYPVPAFIPGLDYNGRYEVRCRGERYRPAVTDSTIFIERRGAVIEIDLPCQPVAEKQPR